MANLTETATYDAGVYQIETTDPVSGGSTGIANKPLINLANRTAYLKNKVDGIIGGTENLTGYAKIASPTFTGSPAAPTPALGDDDTSLATTAFVQDTLGGYLSKSVAGGSSVTLTAVEAGNGVLHFTGALTANIDVIVPATPTRPWIVSNGTTGAFTLTVKTAAGTGVVVSQGKVTHVFSDGTNVRDSKNDLLPNILSIDGSGSGIDADLLDGQHGSYYAPLASPTFTGTPAAPTATAGTNTTQIATTAFVNTAVANATSGAIGLDSTATNIKMNGTQSAGTLSTAARSDHVHPTDTSRAPLASPTFTGTPAAPTAAAGTNTTQLATTAFVTTAVANSAVSLDSTATNIKMNGTQAAGSLGTAARADHVHPTDTSRAPLASPTFTGTPAAPTAVADTNTTQLATTAFVLGQASSTSPGMDGTAAVGTSTKFARADHVHPTDTSRAPLASPTFTGTPAAPTAAAGTNTTQIATTAFVQAEIAADAAPASHVGSTGAAHGVATTSVAGFMSAADKTSLTNLLGGFGASLNANGYARSPSGLIVQWGQATVYSDGVNGGTTAVTFPIAFPSNCVVVATRNGGGLVGADGIYANRGTSLTGFTAVVDSATGQEGAGDRTVAWIAVGY